jgi:hypothetical protein
MNEIFKNVNITPYDTSMNFYINLEPIIHKMCNNDMDLYLKNSSEKIYEFISNIFNIAAHYRMYFSRMGINNNIILYIQYPLNKTSYNRSIIPKYRSNYHVKLKRKYDSFMVYRLLRDSIKYINIISEYIPNVYFIQSNNIESSVIPYIINKYKPADINVLLTNNNMYDFQYVNFNTLVLLSKQDKSILLNSSNILSYLELKHDTETAVFSPKYIPFISSLYGDMNRNIEKIKGFGLKRIFKLLNTAVLNNQLPKDTCNIDMLLNTVNDKDRTIVSNNYKCIDVEYQYNNIPEKSLNEIYDRFIDRTDIDSIKSLLSKYFNKHPILITELTTLPKRPIEINWDKKI